MKYLVFFILILMFAGSAIAWDASVTSYVEDELDYDGENSSSYSGSSSSPFYVDYYLYVEGEAFSSDIVVSTYAELWGSTSGNPKKSASLSLRGPSNSNSDTETDSGYLLSFTSTPYILTYVEIINEGTGDPYGSYGYALARIDWPN